MNARMRSLAWWHALLAIGMVPFSLFITCMQKMGLEPTLGRWMTVFWIANGAGMIAWTAGLQAALLVLMRRAYVYPMATVAGLVLGLTGVTAAAAALAASLFWAPGVLLNVLTVTAAVCGFVVAVTMPLLVLVSSWCVLKTIPRAVHTQWLAAALASRAKQEHPAVQPGARS